MSELYNKLQKYVSICREYTSMQPKVAIVLGSGLGDLANEINAEAVIPYQDIEGFPHSTISGHVGQFVFGYLHNIPVVAMQGRVHYYEGYSMTDVVMPIRLMHALGAKTLILTNAAGGINKNYVPGTFMVIRDHIASFVPSPLIGPNVEELGVRFPDMSAVYDQQLQEIIYQQGKERGYSIEQGVYIQFTGPQYETPTEVKMAALLGADACGMSTAVEAIVANHMGMRIAGVSCITNMASGISESKLCHQEVEEISRRVSGEFKTLVGESLKVMEQEGLL